MIPPGPHDSGDERRGTVRSFGRRGAVFAASLVLCTIVALPLQAQPQEPARPPAPRNGQVPAAEKPPAEKPSAEKPPAPSAETAQPQPAEKPAAPAEAAQS